MQHDHGGTTALARAAVAALVLTLTAGCAMGTGPGDAGPATDPAGAGTTVTSIPRPTSAPATTPVPPPRSGTTTSGTPTSTPAVTPDLPAVDPQDAAAAAVVRRLNAAIRTKDRTAFLATFATTPQLRARWGRWFDNVTRMPLSRRDFRVAQSRERLPDPKGPAFTVDLAFAHQFARADREPVDEWYRFTVKPGAQAGARPVVTAATGTPATGQGGLDGSRYEQLYPAAWDLDEVAVVTGSRTVLVGPASLRGTMRAAVARADRAAAAVDARLLRPGQRAALPAKWVVTVAPSSRNPRQYFGDARGPSTDEAPDGVAQAVFGTLEHTDGLDRSRPPATTRVVLKASATAASETLVHEFTHAVSFSWADGYPQVPEWVAEGLAQYVEVAEVPAVRSSVLRSARTGFKDAKAFPDVLRLVQRGRGARGLRRVVGRDLRAGQGQGPEARGLLHPHHRTPPATPTRGCGPAARRPPPGTSPPRRPGSPRRSDDLLGPAGSAVAALVLGPPSGRSLRDDGGNLPPGASGRRWRAGMLGRCRTPSPTPSAPSSPATATPSARPPSRPT